MKISVMVTVKGVVQGVNFRYYTLQNALRYKVNGWVRNLPDGRVEGCFEGEDTDVEALVRWCRSGPPSARVDEVTVDRRDVLDELLGFEIRR